MVVNSGSKYTIKDKAWMKHENGMPLYDFWVEKAPSGRSRCGTCGLSIDRSKIRLSKPMADPRGQYGLISIFHHPECLYFPIEKGNRIQRRRIYGFDEFTPVEQEDLVKILNTKPAHLTEINPDDCVIHRDLAERSPPSEITRALFPFQKRGLGWLVGVEESIEADEKAGNRPFSSGGILADEMGLGKTIMTIAHIVARKSQGLEGPTLVISPLSSMLQWFDEIAAHVTQNTISVYIYHGAGTNKTARELEKYDVVLTTYQTIEKQWQKLTQSKKVMCEICGKRLLPRKMNVHRQYFCGENAERTAKQRKQEKKQSFETIAKGLNTLKVIQGSIEESSSSKNKLDEEAGDTEVAMRSVTPWKIFNELTKRNASQQYSTKRKRESKLAKAKTESPLPIKQEEQSEEQVHPPYNTDRPSEIEERDIEGYEDDSLDFSLSPLHEIQWLRIVLDEAHRIKSKNTSTSRSVYALVGRFKLVLTGTPLQNRAADLYSLIRFLRVEKFSRYYCQKKGCSCSSLSYPFTVDNHRHCQLCGHSPLMHCSYFNRQILNPIRRYGYVGVGQDALMHLKGILDRIMLRRKKSVLVDDLNLPPLDVQLLHVELRDDERDFYEALYKQSEAKFDSFVQKGTLVNNYAHIFDLLSSLRQSLDHPFLVLHRPSLDNISSQIDANLTWSADVCNICHDTIFRNEKHAVQLKPCKHVFHKSCIAEYIRNVVGEPGCPRCFCPVSVDLTALESLEDSDNDNTSPQVNPTPSSIFDGPNEEEQLPVPPSDNFSQEGIKSTRSMGPKKVVGRRSIMQRFDVANFKSSSKLDAIIGFIKTIPSNEKIIVFSQYASMLDLLEWQLEKENFKSVKLLGSMPLVMRRSMLTAFREDESVRIILMSLRAGGEGLNLQVASRVIIIDPWWNPSVENQAIQRAHRIGQSKPVYATRFICHNTIEDRMIELQDKKMLVFDGTIDSNAAAMAQLTSDDMLFLFQR